jgi:hypothetical protein
MINDPFYEIPGNDYIGIHEQKDATTRNPGSGITGGGGSTLFVYLMDSAVEVPGNRSRIIV